MADQTMENWIIYDGDISLEDFLERTDLRLSRLSIWLFSQVILNNGQPYLNTRCRFQNLRNRCFLKSGKKRQENVGGLRKIMSNI